jgi:hypothetical protein
VATTVRVYVDDSFLRACRTGIYANGTNAALGNLASVIVDNTHIERGRGPVQSFGVWVQGAIDVSLRKSLISRQDVAIQFDSPLGGKVSHVELINSELTRNTTALNFVNATASAQGQIAITGSQIFGSTDATAKIANSAGGNNRVARGQPDSTQAGQESSWPIRQPTPTPGCTSTRRVRRSPYHGERCRY